MNGAGEDGSCRSSTPLVSLDNSFTFEHAKPPGAAGPFTRMGACLLRPLITGDDSPWMSSNNNECSIGVMETLKSSSAARAVRTAQLLCRHSRIDGLSIPSPQLQKLHARPSRRSPSSQDGDIARGMHRQRSPSQIGCRSVLVSSCGLNSHSNLSRIDGKHSRRKPEAALHALTKTPKIRRRQSPCHFALATNNYDSCCP